MPTRWRAPTWSPICRATSPVRAAIPARCRSTASPGARSLRRSTQRRSLRRPVRRRLDGVQTKTDLRAHLAGWGFHDLTFGGTAPCDWITRARATAKLVRPDFVVVSFLGNNFTACTGGANGSALVEQYRRDITTICQQTAPAACVLVGQAVLMSSAKLAMPNGKPPSSTVRWSPTSLVVRRCRVRGRGRRRWIRSVATQYRPRALQPRWCRALRQRHRPVPAAMAAP